MTHIKQGRETMGRPPPETMSKRFTYQQTEVISTPIDFGFYIFFNN